MSQKDDLDTPHSSLFPKGRGNYKFLEEIARGGMGIVLRGHDTDLGRDVAVKVLAEERAGDPGVLQRFVEEAQIGGQLQHPGVVPVYEMGTTEDERPYFAMKLIEGRTLSALLEGRKGLGEDRRRFLAIFETVCQTVAYAHSKGVIHRDLKPENVMVGEFGEVQVVDWGLAKVLNENEEPARARQGPAGAIHTVRSGPESSAAQSIVGTALGTPAYMPPEQALGALERVDERSDVFALGGVLCETLTGAPPYVAGEGEHTLLLAARAELEPARKRVEACGADSELRELCLACLAAAPEDRPSGAEEVARRIQKYLGSLEEKAHRAELAATEARELRRRHRLLMVLGATVFAASITIGLVLRSQERQQTAIRLERLAAVREDLDDAAVDVAELQDAGDHSGALVAAGSALQMARGSEVVEPGMIRRAQRLVDSAKQRGIEFERRQGLARKNAALLARCDELHALQADTVLVFGPMDWAGDLDAAYVQAFEDYGIDLADEDVMLALETLLTSHMGPEVALALDDWAGLRRTIHSPGAYEVEVVTALAFDLDPDPARTRLREALLADDEQALLSFLREEDLEALHPATLWSLSRGLTSMERYDECFAVVRDGARLHPQDFLLNVRAGQLYGQRRAYLAALGFLSAARGVRPTSAAVHALLADYLREMGNAPEAAFLYSEALRLNSNYTAARNNLAWLQLLLGDYSGSAQSYALLFERFPEQTIYDYKYLIARFMSGEASRLDVIARLASDASLAGRPESAAAWALCHHPDPAQRDPARVIAIQDSWNHEEPATEAMRAAALVQLGRPAEALAALDHGEELLGGGNVNVFGATSAKLQADYAVFRARAHHDLGDDERARVYLRTADEYMRGFMVDGQEPWAETPWCAGTARPARSWGSDLLRIRLRFE